MVAAQERVRRGEEAVQLAWRKGVFDSVAELDEPLHAGFGIGGWLCDAPFPARHGGPRGTDQARKIFLGDVVLAAESLYLLDELGLSYSPGLIAARRLTLMCDGFRHSRNTTTFLPSG